MFKDFKSLAYKYAINVLGWRTNRKIIVIESDDWGSIRMPSRDVYEKCLKAGYPVDKNAYERYDSLLSEDDLALLFDLLTSFKDINGSHPSITANCVVANPDFKKIREDDFQKYHFELITETFKRYPRHGNNFKLWKQGAEQSLFFPQFHAREHLNVSLFMKALQKGDKDALWGFENGMPGSIPKGPIVRGNEFVEATKYDSEEDKEEKLKIFLEGLDLFKNLFGYTSESIIPPNYIWSLDFNHPVFEKGVKYFQGRRNMQEPLVNGRDIFHKRHIGYKNKIGQVFTIRNCRFEPSLIKREKELDNCLSAIRIAFSMKKPAIICSHRINYVGFIDEKNRDNNLYLLKKLIKTAQKEWPEVEFLTSIHLGKLMS